MMATFLTFAFAGLALMIVGKLLIKIGNAMQRWGDRH